MSGNRTTRARASVRPPDNRDELGIDSDSIAEQRKELSHFRKQDAEEEAACLRGVIFMVVAGYLAGKWLR